jgi:hypothetical protein
VLEAAAPLALLVPAHPAPAQSPIPPLPADSVWRQDISSAPVAADSSQVLSWLDGFELGDLSRWSAVGQF